MAKKMGASATIVGRIWRANGLKPHLSRTFILSRDKHFAEKVQDVVGLYMNPPENALVLSVDEKSAQLIIEKVAKSNALLNSLH